MAIKISSTFRYIGITIDGAGSVITTGLKQYMIIPFNCIITGWNIVSNEIGSCVIDIWKNTTIPTSENVITGSEKPTLSTQQTNNDYSLTTWTNKTITAGDIIAFNVNSITTIKKVTVTLVVKTMG